MARLWLHERQQLEGPELSRQLLDGWVGNFSSVVRFTQAQLPQVLRKQAREGGCEIDACWRLIAERFE